MWVTRRIRERRRRLSHFFGADVDDDRPSDSMDQHDDNANDGINGDNNKESSPLLHHAHSLNGGSSNSRQKEGGGLLYSYDAVRSVANNNGGSGAAFSGASSSSPPPGLHPSSLSDSVSSPPRPSSSTTTGLPIVSTSAAAAPVSPRSSRKADYVPSLVRKQKASERYLRRQLGVPVRERSVLANIQETSSRTTKMDDASLKELQEDCVFLKKAFEIRQETLEYINPQLEQQRSVQVRLDNVSYVVPIDETHGMIETVTQGKLFKYYKSYKAKQKRKSSHSSQHQSEHSQQEQTSCLPHHYSNYQNNNNIHEDETPVKYILRDIHLVLRPGRSYLVLGAPGAGKTSLLKAIASLLPESKNGPQLHGKIDYNGLPMHNPAGLCLKNAVAYLSQQDIHEPLLTVEETFDFAYQCKSGGTHRMPYMVPNPRLDEIISQLDQDKTRVKLTLEGFGLSHVANTYVGDEKKTRGVSGGQRRRVTVGELLMMGEACPILCGDEVSTGLDAASTYQIVRILVRLARVLRTTQVVSLKQASPETVALFDEVVLLAEGFIIFAGPVLEAFRYFDSIGFDPPEDMDDADFLQALSTPDRVQFFWRAAEQCPTAQELSQIFQKSEYGQEILDKLKEPLAIDWSVINDDDDQTTTKNRDELLEQSLSIADWRTPTTTTTSEADTNDNKDQKTMLLLPLDAYRKRYMISWWRATVLNTKRHFVVWKRDVRFVRANFIKNVVMGISVGMVFFQTDIVVSILGVLFQSTLFIMLGASTAAPSQIDERSVFYKHADHNFFPALSFVLGRTLAFIPQAIGDVLTFGTIIYFLVGLEPAASNYFVFVAVLLTFTITMSTMFGVVTSIAPTKSTVQALTSVLILLNMYFCGFLVAPEVIPPYYGWLYWWNPLSWTYRALLLNEYLGPSYNGQIPGTEYTEGEWILLSKGYTFHGEPFRKEWVAYCFAYLCPFVVLSVIFASLGLEFIRYDSDGGGGGGHHSSGDDGTLSLTDGSQRRTGSPRPIDVPFTPVHLTFENICYEVEASTGKETLKLLNNVYGHLRPGRMCALMGESGAGKTTLMDVIALRKHSGKATGDVRLNGHLQEEAPFRRCSGYVEQFDVRTPQLTVHETVAFSAHMRLDSTNHPQMKSYVNREKFVSYIIDMMELGPQEGMLVGDDDTGGLSFEQRKRLSIAVELAASPSVLFLDEPTSGLDSRAALLVANSLRKIASTGRTVCATIHQPSSAVFGMFDDLLLMKKGGHVVYFGELGPWNRNLVDYFEARGARPMNRGENAATWMLSAITPDPTSDHPIDYVKLYESSVQRKILLESIAAVKAAATEANKITFESAYALSSIGRNMLMRKRLHKIYWRSPAYNRSRIILSLVLSFLLGSVFVNNRSPEIMSEPYISGVFSTIFISFIITGIMAITTVLPVMLQVRDVFYRHRAAGMLNHWSLTWALASAEQGFILISSAMYCAVFYFTIGLDLNFGKFVAFWGFFTFNLAINSYFGQAFMCLVKGMGTAQILCSILIGMNNFFSGLIVRPQYLHGFWQAPYWITPGRYVYEGLIAPQFYDDHRTVVASLGSDFQIFLACTDEETIAGECHGTVAQYMDSFFGGRFHASHTALNASVLGVFLVIARVSTHIALHKCNHTSSG